MSQDGRDDQETLKPWLHLDRSNGQTVKPHSLYWPGPGHGNGIEIGYGFGLQPMEIRTVCLISGHPVQPSSGLALNGQCPGQVVEIGDVKAMALPGQTKRLSLIPFIGPVKAMVTDSDYSRWRSRPFVRLSDSDQRSFGAAVYSLKSKTTIITGINSMP